MTIVHCLGQPVQKLAEISFHVKLVSVITKTPLKIQKNSGRTYDI